MEESRRNEPRGGQGGRSGIKMDSGAGEKEREHQTNNQTPGCRHCLSGCSQGTRRRRQPSEVNRGDTS